MDISIIFQIATIGILISVLNQVLIRAGRDEQATMITLVGIIVVLIWVMQYINDFFELVKSLFQF